MLRSRFPRMLPSRVFRRNVHVPPPMPQFQNGIDEFLSPTAIDISWNQYQTLMVNRLNNIVAGTVDEHVEPKNLLLKYARDPDQAATFNYASMAHNNHFFFEGLSKKKVAMPGDLLSSLKRSFSSYETLRREFISHAESMFGPGFVWLVARRSSAVQANKPAEYAILTTYLAGSPYPGAHYRRQTQDMNTQNESSAPVNSVGAMGRHSESAKGPELLGGFINEANLVPILCINTWEHVWLPDYSISGKKEYARRFWEKIDWEKVRERAHAAK